MWLQFAKFCSCQHSAHQHNMLRTFCWSPCNHQRQCSKVINKTALNPTHHSTSYTVSLLNYCQHPMSDSLTQKMKLSYAASPPCARYFISLTAPHALSLALRLTMMLLGTVFPVYIIFCLVSYVLFIVVFVLYCTGSVWERTKTHSCQLVAMTINFLTLESAERTWTHICICGKFFSLERFS